MPDKILLHACCATCSGFPFEKLAESGFIPVVYYFNPNIFPQSEFQKRLDELVKYAGEKNIELIIEEYNHKKWLTLIKGLENEPEKGFRCKKCFEIRLEKTAQKAVELGIKYFTTTLSVSPHKKSSVIFEVAKIIAQKYKLNFADIDFKKQNGFLRTMQIAKEQGFYRQNYCGCEFSLR